MGGYIRTFILLAALTALFGAAGYAIGGGTGAVIALLIAGAMNLYAWWGSAGAVLRMHNAQPVSEQDAPRLYAMVRRLSERAAIPMPALYVIHEDQPNAFATGRGPSNAAVAVNSGLIDLMTEQQVAGVVAHELAHIKHRDTLVMSIAATLSGAIGMLAQFGGMFAMRGRDGQRGSNPIAAIAVMILGPIAAAIVQMAISRAREYEADREGAEIAGDPEWLASGLERLEAGSRQAVNEAAEANPATAHMFIVNPLSAGGIRGLFTTHPPTAERVARLRAMRPTGGLAMGAPAGVSPWSVTRPSVTPPSRNPWRR
jgi:heat shock protein HtpX